MGGTAAQEEEFNSKDLATGKLLCRSLFCLNCGKMATGATTMPVTWCWEDVLSSMIDTKKETNKVSLHDAHGGYDLDLVEDTEDDHLCDVCSKILRNPHLTLCCGKHYCETCLEQWLEKQHIGEANSCPQCRKTPFEHVLDKSMMRKLNAIKVMCVHKEEGCNWKGELGTIETHLDSGTGCGYIPIPCPNHCKSILRRLNIQVHLTNECVLRQSKCEHCGFSARHDKITEHFDSCQEYPVQCPKNCEELVKRRHLAAHKHKCLMEEVDCPFQCVGCYVQVKRKEFEEHLKQETHTHLSYFMDSFKNLKSSLDTISTNVSVSQIVNEQKIGELEATLVETKTKLENLEKNQKLNWFYAKVGFSALFVLFLCVCFV